MALEDMLGGRPGMLTIKPDVPPWTIVKIVALSKWVDNAACNRDRDPEALGWHRVAKVAEEAGEAVGEWLLYTGGNPRRDPSPDTSKVIEELLDTAIAALGAVEHLTGNQGVSLRYLVSKIDTVHARAGL